MGESTKYSANDQTILRNEGMSLQEIADELGMTPHQVRHIIYRAMNKLKLKAIARRLVVEDYYDTERSRRNHV